MKLGGLLVVQHFDELLLLLGTLWLKAEDESPFLARIVVADQLGGAI